MIDSTGFTGANYGHKVRPWSHGGGGAPNLGQCFVAVDPGHFAPGFGDRLLDCIQTWRKLTPVSSILLIYISVIL